MKCKFSGGTPSQNHVTNFTVKCNLQHFDYARFTLMNFNFEDSGKALFSTYCNVYNSSTESLVQYAFIYCSVSSTVHKHKPLSKMLVSLAWFSVLLICPVPLCLHAILCIVNPENKRINKIKIKNTKHFQFHFAIKRPPLTVMSDTNQLLLNTNWKLSNGLFTFLPFCINLSQEL